MIPLSEFDISVGFISFFDEMPERDRKIVVRAQPNAVCGNAIFYYVGKYIGNDMIDCSYDGQNHTHYTHYTHWQYKEYVEKVTKLVSHK